MQRLSCSDAAAREDTTDAVDASQPKQAYAMKEAVSRRPA
jgi:hypothetical protein